MQQFATTQTSIAANKLPFDDVKLSSSAPRNTSSSSFDVNAQNDSTQKSAFKEALARHEKSSQPTAENLLDDNLAQRAELTRKREVKEARQDSVDRANEQSQIKRRNRDVVDEHQNVDFDKSPEDAAIPKSLVSDKKRLAENITDDFDWVAYVNKVKDLSGPSDPVPIDLYIEDKSSTHAIFAQTIASLDSDGDALDNAKSVDVNIVNTDSDPEFLEINLTQKELATLVNAAGGNSEEPMSVNSETMKELDNAIAKLLNQLVSKEDSDVNKNAELEITDIAKDADLLKNLLQAETLEVSDGKKLLMTSEDDIEELGVVIKSNDEFEQANKQIDDLILIENHKAVEIEKSVLSALKIDDNLTLKSLEATQSKQAVVAEVETEVVNATLSQTEKPLVEKNDKVVESPLFVSVDKAPTKKQAQLLATLPPEATNSAIDNIATRVESAISELKTEGKSTEFIAALQSGVKEMKEQLKQGREPGIDLKSLVTDALAAANVKVTGNTEIALDKQLNQISNILAAATSLNQTNQQQNYLNTGLNEVQGIKEVAQQQIESTRLVQQTSANDKGVNIFKPEGQQQLTEKVRWMVNSRNITAEIRLDPPDLGGMNIKVNLSGDSASVSFVVQSQHARDALDQAVPRLREMLEEQGIELGQSSVQQESAGSDEQAEKDNLANNSNDSDNLAQQSQDGIQDSNENGLLDHNDIIEQRISGGRIGGIDYYV
ncbi:MAG: flagellar hook-length control protein FliK [Glaciecola sp.]|jgi:flagellar hook-length control protein FliK